MIHCLENSYDISRQTYVSCFVVRCPAWKLVPIGISFLGWGTVTLPLIFGCRNCMWEPEVVTFCHPFCLRILIIDRPSMMCNNTHLLNDVNILYAGHWVQAIKRINLSFPGYIINLYDSFPAATWPFCELATPSPNLQQAGSIGKDIKTHATSWTGMPRLWGISWYPTVVTQDSLALQVVRRRIQPKGGPGHYGWSIRAASGGCQVRPLLAWIDR